MKHTVRVSVPMTRVPGTARLDQAARHYNRPSPMGGVDLRPGRIITVDPETGLVLTISTTVPTIMSAEEAAGYSEAVNSSK